MIAVGIPSLWAQTSTSIMLSGIAWDKEANEGLAYANIALKSNNSEGFYGTTANEIGEFNVQVSPGTYTLTISFMGYKPYTNKNLRITSDSSKHFLGTLSLLTDAQFIRGAEVRGEKQEMILDVDKKVFNVENNAITVGGTAEDVLNQLPAVDIDVDGNVTLRGSSDVLIFINGRQTGMSGSSPQALLQQIPAANIERVEIINNPSAKYDAEGTSGIINIILKKNTKDGWNANGTAGVGTNYKYNASATFSQKKNKSNFSVTYGFRDHENWSRGTSDRTNFPGDTVFYIDQNSHRNRRSVNHTLNGSYDYQASSKTNLNLSFLGSVGSRESLENVDFEFLDNKRMLTHDYLRRGTEDNINYSAEIGAGFTHNYDQKGHQLSFFSNFSFSDRNEYALFEQDLEGPGPNRQNQITDKDNVNFLPVVQLDYVRPGKKNLSTFEAGAKFTMRSMNDNFFADTLDFNFKERIIDQGLTNNFLYDEIVNAAYFNYANDFNWVKIKLGLRVENTLISGEQKVNNEDFNNQYTHPFPSLFITRGLRKGEDIQGSYSRRIKRPGIRTLNPFAEQTDPFNLRIGNPDLQPELIDAYEFTYFRAQRGNFLSATIYYRQVNGVHQRVRNINDMGVATMSWYNLDVSRNAGLEGIARRKIGGVNTTLNLNMFRNQVSGSALNTDLSAVNYSWFGKLLANYKLGKKWDIQGSYFYRGRITYVQGVIEPMHGLDLGFKWNVLGDRGTLTLNVTDVFNTKQFALQNEGINFEGSMIRKWETRILTVNFSYKLGNLNPDWEKKERRRSREDGGGEDMDF